MAKDKELGVEVEEVEEKVVKEDEAHAAFRKLIEVYKKQNPVKYEAKKEALAKKLAGKLAFGINPNDGQRDGSIISVN